MADPVSWGIGLSAASAGISAIGAVRQGQAESSADSYNAQVAQQNAAAATSQGAAAADAQWRTAEQRIGSSIAAFGGSGVQGGTGSPTSVLASNIQNATLDNLTTQYNYKLKALGYTDQANLDSAEASNATTSGYLNALGATARGAGQVAYMNSSSNPSGGYQIPGSGYGSNPMFSNSPNYGFGS